MEIQVGGYETPLIELANATIFQMEVPILEYVNLSIGQGEFVYIVGKTGTGKSSLLKTLYGDLPLQKGIGNVVGADLKQMNWKRLPFLRRKLGIIFQDFQLLTDRNVEDNLSFALEVTGWKEPKAISQRIGEVLKDVGMGDKRLHMPFKLSGGEQQRIAIARALLNKPSLVLADEPTGNLDPETSEDIIQLMWNINKEQHTTFLIGTHDYYTIEKFPGRILRTQGQRLIDQGMLQGS